HHPEVVKVDNVPRQLREIGEEAPRGVVLVIDQLEELVTLCSDAGERRAFAEALAAAADGPSAPVRVVASLRDDFATVIEGEDATCAAEIYASLPRRDQDVVRDLFARLVAADGTRVPWPRRELEELPGARSVLAHLVDARLLVIRDDDGHDVVEIVHECLAE